MNNKKKEDKFTKYGADLQRLNLEVNNKSSDSTSLQRNDLSDSLSIISADQIKIVDLETAKARA